MSSHASDPSSMPTSSSTARKNQSEGHNAQSKSINKFCLGGSRDVTAWLSAHCKICAINPKVFSRRMKPGWSRLFNKYFFYCGRENSIDLQFYESKTCPQNPTWKLSYSCRRLNKAFKALHVRSPLSLGILLSTTFVSDVIQISIFAFGFDFEQHLRQTIWFDFHSIETLSHDRKASRLRPLFRSRFMYSFTYFLTKIKI